MASIFISRMFCPPSVCWTLFIEGGKLGFLINDSRSSDPPPPKNLANIINNKTLCKSVKIQDFRDIETIQIPAVLWSTKILRKILEIYGDMRSHGLY